MWRTLSGRKIVKWHVKSIKGWYDMAISARRVDSVVASRIRQEQATAWAAIGFNRAARGASIRQTLLRGAV